MDVEDVDDVELGNAPPPWAPRHPQPGALQVELGRAQQRWPAALRVLPLGVVQAELGRVPPPPPPVQLHWQQPHAPEVGLDKPDEQLPAAPRVLPSTASEAFRKEAWVASAAKPSVKLVADEKEWQPLLKLTAKCLAVKAVVVLFCVAVAFGPLFLISKQVVATCDTLGKSQCPSDALVGGASSIACTSWPCTKADDEGTCCKALATCDVFAASDCASGALIDTPENSTCLSWQCSRASDDHRCCKATCDSFSPADCDSSLTITASPSSIVCSSQECSKAADENTCCMDARTPASSFPRCASSGCIAHIVAGAFHAVLLRGDGKAFSIGDNEKGQLGLGHTQPQNMPELISGLPPLRSVAAGADASVTFFISRQGEVWATGFNGNSQLGLGHTGNRLVPQRVIGLPPVKQVAVGDSHSLFLTVEGDVWAAGRNAEGRLGLGDSEQVNTPQKIPGLPKIDSVAAGAGHSIFLTTDGDVWVTGYNRYGALGLGDIADRLSPVQLVELPSIQAVAAAASQSFFLTKTGDVWATGRNTAGQLGFGDTWERHKPKVTLAPPRVKAVAAGSTHTVYLTEGGEVWTTGGNYWGQLGQGHNDQLLMPVQVSGLHQIAHIAGGNHHALLAGGDLTWLTAGKRREQLSGDDTSTEWNTFNGMLLPADSGR